MTYRNMIAMLVAFVRHALLMDIYAVAAIRHANAEMLLLKGRSVNLISYLKRATEVSRLC